MPILTLELQLTILALTAGDLKPLSKLWLPWPYLVLPKASTIWLSQVFTWYFDKFFYILASMFSSIAFWIYSDDSIFYWLSSKAGFKWSIECETWVRMIRFIWFKRLFSMFHCSFVSLPTPGKLEKFVKFREFAVSGCGEHGNVAVIYSIYYPTFFSFWCLWTSLRWYLGDFNVWNCFALVTTISLKFCGSS